MTRPTLPDPGDELSRRYRELAREEPPAAVDAAILAASRRAVGSRGRPKWAGPVSIAAVLVLGIGVALRMQVEQPGVESSPPAAQSEYSVPQAAETPAPQEKTEAARSAPAPAASATTPAEAPAKAAPRPKRAEPEPSPAMADAPPPAAMPPTPASPPAAAAPRSAAPPATETRPAPPAPPPAAITVPMQSTAPPSEPSAMRAEAAREPSRMGVPSANQESPAPRLQRERFAADSLPSAQAPRDAREAELERIAKLRAEGRHDEADKALDEFRRRHPGYRIPPPVWERVKPR